MGRENYDVFVGPTMMIDIPFIYGSQTANAHWATDLSWFLTTAIDLNSTYIGGSQELIESILECEELETFVAEVDDDVTIFSDSIN